ncbi:DUF3263 domain-containing protein [Corynebacterium tapiri]|uniref:DUF3263 domain-containing protein n=2 Tax=Corynebacterium tapiri TaxID=1448266 RepID=A0A5C4U242_9CORY|nr:DUF3263 domain-containing protein [Corynebacterium tapiri]
MPYSLGMPSLSPLDARILEFEASAPRSVGAKEEAIKEAFGMEPMRYYQRLNMLIDAPPAMQSHPLLTARLRRLRDRREDARRATRG